MKNSNLEYIILYVLVACVALVLATSARAFAVGMGFDEFTSFMVFVVVLGIAVIVYLSIHVVLQGFMLPLIDKGLSKIPFFRDKIEQVQPVDVIIENITVAPSLDDIRSKQLRNREKEQEVKMNAALEYTRNTFAPFVSDKDVETLCENLHLYANKLSLEKLQSIKTNKDLSTIDMFHFGWNIWNHFKVGKQIDIAIFLKKIFPDILKDVEVDTIKSHLKDDELKGNIKIKENLSE